VIVGQQGQETITASEIAQRWGTINYEVTSGIMPRVPRLDRR
jgi:alanine racemase